MELMLTAISAVTALFALGFSSYGYALLKTFKGGYLEKPFKILAPRGFILAVSESVAILGSTVISEWLINVIQITVRSLFILTLFLGSHRFSKLWMAHEQVDQV
ncbi:MAG: hypothetical protein M1503_10470 [Thaumarchaeota archaeon]|nr:hypothetical protein [Nitrososphaerota archaeon]MCL5318664.1 hypothetical protein [Nitrososphaerota archaeon]